VKREELFDVAVRTVGLLVVLPALYTVVFGLLGVALGGPGEVIGLLWFGVPAMAVGLWLMRRADVVVSFAYKWDRRPQYTPSYASRNQHREPPSQGEQKEPTE